MSNNIESLTIGDALKLAAILNPQTQAVSNPWRVGEIYQIRTVTFIYTGRLVAIHPQELVLVDAAWIADTGRFSDACKTGEYSEIEPFRPGVEVIINRGAIVDATAAVKLNFSQK